MFKLRLLSIIGFTLPLLVIPTSSQAADKKSAQVECAATDIRLTYDCMITLTNKKTGQAIDDAEFTVSADMTSMQRINNDRFPCAGFASNNSEATVK